MYDSLSATRRTPPSGEPNRLRNTWRSQPALQENATSGCEKYSCERLAGQIPSICQDAGNTLNELAVASEIRNHRSVAIHG